LRRITLSLALLASLASTAVFADPATQPATQPPKKTGFDQNQIVCKQVDVTGSHLGGERICMSWADWEAQSQADERSLREAELRPGASAVPGGISPAGGSSGGRMH